VASKSIDAEGLQETLRVLRRLEPDIRKEVPRRFKAAGAPLVSAARAEVPAQAPMSGWKKGGRLGWSSARARTSIIIKFRASGRRHGEFTLLKLYTRSPALSVYEFAEKAQRRGRNGRRNHPNSSEAFIRNIRRSGKEPGRVLWNAADRELDSVVEAVEDIIEDLEQTANRALKRRR
jgi:hypothetical protein